MREARSISVAGLIGVAVLAAGCASTGAVPRPFPMPGAANSAAAGRPPAPAVFDRGALTGIALTLRGAPYRNGGSDPSGFDCSGFIQYVFARQGLQLPRDVREQFESGRPVKLREIAPGDLVFFSTVARGASHVGLALGGDQFVHAPSSRGVVRVEHISAKYWSRRFVGARRLG